MSKGDIVRAWKDAEYRQRLSIEEQALLPEHPAGSIELAQEDLHQVAGGVQPSFNPFCSLTVCSFMDDCTYTTITLA